MLSNFFKFYPTNYVQYFTIWLPLLVTLSSKLIHLWQPPTHTRQTCLATQSKNKPPKWSHESGSKKECHPNFFLKFYPTNYVQYFTIWLPLLGTLSSKLIHLWQPPTHSHQTCLATQSKINPQSDHMHLAVKKDVVQIF